MRGYLERSFVERGVTRRAGVGDGPRELLEQRGDLDALLRQGRGEHLP